MKSLGSFAVSVMAFNLLSERIDARADLPRASGNITTLARATNLAQHSRYRD
jgi:hypothetical protein